VSFKTLGRKTVARMGSQILTVKTHSPAILIGTSAVGFTATVVLACRATLKLSDILAEGEENLKKANAASGEKFGDDEIKKAKFGIKLQTAINVAKVYALPAAFGIFTFACMTGSYTILKKRNAGLAAAYAIVDKGFKDYRKRVVADQGEQKDFEYAHGVETREIVKETADGPVVETVTGLDQDSIRTANPEKIYKRLFHGPERDADGNLVEGGYEGHKQWSDIPLQNQFFLQTRQSELNDLLRYQGHLFLNQAYDILGFEPTIAGQEVGWLKNPKEGEGDGYVSLGVWDNGTYRGIEWLNGNADSILLDFNVDGPILHALKEM